MNELLGLEIIWVHVSRLPMLHLDKTDGNILYLTSFLLLGGDATQFLFFFFGKSLPHSLDRSCTFQNNFFFFCKSFLFYGCTPPSCACMLVVFHPISLIVKHSYSSSCRWWCRKFIFFVLYTIICMCHLISLIHMWHISHKFLHMYKITSTTKLPVPNTWCVSVY